MTRNRWFEGPAASRILLRLLLLLPLLLMTRKGFPGVSAWAPSPVVSRVVVAPGASRAASLLGGHSGRVGGGRRRRPRRGLRMALDSEDQEASPPEEEHPHTHEKTNNSNNNPPPQPPRDDGASEGVSSSSAPSVTDPIDGDERGSVAASGTSQSSSNHNAEGNGNDSVPSYKQLFVFVATTVLIWMSEPLLSLIDTTIVGLTQSPRAGVVQIAALGPATTLYDSAIYSTYFLAIAATNLISPALAAKDYRKLRRSTSHLLGLAAVFGLLVSAVCFGLGPFWMAQMLSGGGAASAYSEAAKAEILGLAKGYAFLRASVAPLAVVDFVAQSFCLAILDTRTPAVAVVAASFVNIAGDLLLAPRWGIQGAAAATALATTTSCLLLLRRVYSQTKEWELKTAPALPEEAMVAAASSSSSSESPATTLVVDGCVELVRPPPSTANGKGTPQPSLSKEPSRSFASLPLPTKDPNEIPFWSLPDGKSLVDLFRLAGPIFLIMMGKIACYSVLTIRATQLGMVPLAAHNIMMRVFYFFACFGDSISQAAQTFYARVRKPNKAKLLRRLFLLGAGVGLFVSRASHGVLVGLGKGLTKDPVILEQLAAYAPHVAAAIGIHPLLMLFEGTILAARDLRFLVGMYTVTMALHCGLVFSSSAATFRGLWEVFFGFQFVRLVQLASRWLWTARPSQTERLRLWHALIAKWPWGRDRYSRTGGFAPDASSTQPQQR